MTSSFLAGFDAYQIQARIYPALLAVLPLTVATYATLDLTFVQGLAPLLASAGGVYLFASIARGQGLRAQERLLAMWDGWPTTWLLRHASPGNAAIRARRHERLSMLCGEPLPSAHEETVNPHEANERYALATRVLIARVRQNATHFPRIQEELIHYGFRRNLYGLRPLGLVSSLTAAAWTASAAWFAEPSIGSWAALAIAATALFLWLALVRPEWVRQAGERYADRLFEALESDRIVT